MPITDDNLLFFCECGRVHKLDIQVGHNEKGNHFIISLKRLALTQEDIVAINIMNKELLKKKQESLQKVKEKKEELSPVKKGEIIH